MSYEAYGTVNTTPRLRRRRQTPTTATFESSTTAGRTAARSTTGAINTNLNQPGQRQKQDKIFPTQSKSKLKEANIKPVYSYSYSNNNQVRLLIIPCLFSLFFIHSNDDDGNDGNNDILLLITLYCILTLYILDLANWKHGFHTSIWISLVLILCVLCWEWCTTSSEHDSRFFGSSISSSNTNSNRSTNSGRSRQVELWCIFLFSIWNLIAKMMLFFCLVSFFALDVGSLFFF